jgi:hypothetical protein
MQEKVSIPTPKLTIRSPYGRLEREIRSPKCANIHAKVDDIVFILRLFLSEMTVKSAFVQWAVLNKKVLI